MPGMVKLRCQAYRFWFAAHDAAAEHCPECAIRLDRSTRRAGEVAAGRN